MGVINFFVIYLGGGGGGKNISGETRAGVIKIW